LLISARARSFCASSASTAAASQLAEARGKSRRAIQSAARFTSIIARDDASPPPASQLAAASA
jgi:hypothetical protein